MLSARNSYCGLVRPVLVFLAVRVVRAEHFLHEHHVGAHLAHGVAQLGQDEFAVEGGEALVDVHGHHRQTVSASKVFFWSADSAA
jgi:hypothetical protein